MLTAINNHVIIKEVEKTEQRIGSLVVPETVNVREKTKTGIVIASGPGLALSSGERVPNSVQADDVVIFSQAMCKFSYDGAEYFLLRDDMVMAKMEPEQAS